MKKSLAVVAVVLGVFFALRYMERSIPPARLPTQQSAPAVPEGLTPPALPATSPQEPSPTTPLPAQLPPGSGVPDLDALLASIERWKAVPDLRLLSAQCEASPKDKVGELPKQASPVPTPWRAVLRLTEEVLCSGRLEDCARIETMERPPEFDRPGQGSMTKQWCLNSTVVGLYARSLGEGKPNEAFCRGWLMNITPRPYAEEDTPSLCAMLASDAATGKRSYCDALRDKYGVDDREYGHCLEMVLFVGGEKACLDALKDPGRRDHCLSLARIYSAARTRDISKCKEKVFPGIEPHYTGPDPNCLAVMGDSGTCKADDGVAAAQKKWYQKRCPAWALAQLQAWVQDVDANAQFAIDRLPMHKERLATLASGQQSFYAPKIDAAMKSVGNVQKLMEQIRDDMNKGRLPGQGPSGGG